MIEDCSVPYIDIHTHQVKSFPHTLSLYNKETKDIDSKNYFSLSVHPWHLPASIEKLHDFFAWGLSHPQCLCIGEVGLDKKHPTSMEEQLLFFTYAVKEAARCNSPALILHSVKAHQECLQVIKESHYRGAIIFHDYYGEIKQTLSILKNDQVFLSLGSVLKRPQSKLYPYLNQLPLKRLFFETDDGQEEVAYYYKKYSELTQTPLHVLKKTCFQNFKHIFSSKVSL